MNCTNCGAELHDTAKFCSECGTATALACPNCGEAISAADKFCSECGHNLDSVSAAAAPSVVATGEPAQRPEERRFITALFTDLVGFTPLTEERDAEEVRGMLTQYFDRAREIVARYGGAIDKFIGDAVMAVWGADTAHEDDAERAVRAGLDLVEAVEDLGRQLGLPELKARSGALSGEAAVGADGNAMGLIIGDIVNVASRLQGAAEPGTVLVGRSTRDLTGMSIEFESAGSVELKGKSETVETWRAVRVISGHGGNRRADGLVPPFVGRQDEMRLLKDSLSSVGSESRIRLVSIVGQGGIGKSRLIDEFWNYADGLSDTTYWHEGRSPAYGDGLSFWALGEMVRQRAGIAESDDDHRTRTKLRTALAEHISDHEDREWMLPRFEALLGLSEAPEGDRAELFAAWRLLFTRLAERNPTVMVFEDLHWADEGLLDFIDELTGIATDFPILVVTVARPSLLERRSGWGSDRTNAISLRLAPLAPATMTELVQGVVTDAPPDLVEGLVERAGGIPLYAVELMRMLHARSLIATDSDGRFHMSGDVADIEIPDSLHGLIGARLDQLEGDERSLLQDAAVLGQSFTVQGLLALREATGEELTAALEPLVRREVLTVERDPRSPERGQYRFVQSIIREVAHQRISKADRLERHMRVAEYFQSLDDPEVAGVVASHYLDALEVSPEGEAADEVRARAIAGLLAAADRAEALQSHDQVIRLCERGIELTADPGQRGELLLRAARSAHANLDERREGFARQALDSFGEASDQQGRLRAATVLGRIFDDSRRANEAWPLLLEVVDEGDTEAHAAAMGELARAYMFEYQFEDGMMWADRALTIAEQLDLIPVFTDALVTKGVALGQRYRNREGLALLEKGLELAREHQLMTTKRRAIQNLLYLGASDIVGDLALMREQLADARRLAEPRQLAEVILLNAWDALWRFEWDRLDSLLAELDPESLPPEGAFAYGNTVEARLAFTGDPKQAEAMAEVRFEDMTSVGDFQSARNVESTRILMAVLNGRYDEAFERARSMTGESPARLDIFWAMRAAMKLRDPQRLHQVAEMVDDCLFRGRSIDMMGLATRGAIQSLEGDLEAASESWGEACRLSDDVWPLGSSAMLWAEAASYLGTDHPLGYERGIMAREAFESVEATTLLEIFADGLPPAEEEAGLLDSA